MFGLFKQDPNKALRKQVKAKFEKARDIQRSGDVLAAAQLYEEAERLQKELESREASD